MVVSLSALQSVAGTSGVSRDLRWREAHTRWFPPTDATSSFHSRATLLIWREILLNAGFIRGGTALLLARVLTKAASKRLYLFDSFKGLPRMDKEKDPWFSEGQYCSESVEAVEALLADFRNMVDIRAGWIPETFQGLETGRYAFVHSDVDLYQSTLDCCKYFYPRLVIRWSIVV